MAKKEEKTIEVKPEKSAGDGGSKKKIIAIVVVVVIVIAVIGFLLMGDGGDDDNGNGENQPPTAEFTYSPENPIANQPVNFDAANSTDPDEDDLEFSWDFGDPDATSSNPNTGDGIQEVHTYTFPGEYNVTLNVEDGNGGIDEVAITVTVVEETTPTVDLNPQKYDTPIANIAWTLTVSGTDGTDEQLALTNIRYNIYNGTDTNDVKLTGLVSSLSETDKGFPPNNADGIYFDDYEGNSILSVLDWFSIAGDGGVSIQDGDSFQLIYEPNQMPMMDPETL